MLDLLRSSPPEGADAVTMLRHEAMRFEAAKAAAPYVHPRLATTEFNPDPDRPMRMVVEIRDPTKPEESDAD